MNTDKIAYYLMGLALIVIVIGTQWSYSVVVNKQIDRNMLSYHRGSFNVGRINNPTDPKSEVLYHFIQTISLGRGK